MRYNVGSFSCAPRQLLVAIRVVILAVCCAITFSGDAWAYRPPPGKPTPPQQNGFYVLYVDSVPVTMGPIFLRRGDVGYSCPCKAATNAAQFYGTDLQDKKIFTAVAAAKPTKECRPRELGVVATLADGNKTLLGSITPAWSPKLYKDEIPPADMVWAGLTEYRGNGRDLQRPKMTLAFFNMFLPQPASCTRRKA